MRIITDSTSVDLTCDDDNDDSIKSLPTSPVNDVSIEIPQNHQRSTMSNRLIVVNSTGEGPVDEQALADKKKNYRNNFTPINAPEASVSRTAAAQLQESPDKTATTVHAARPPDLLKFGTEIQSLRGFSKVSGKTSASRKFRIEKENPRHSFLTSPPYIPISKRFRRVNTRQDSSEPLSISEQSSHQVAPATPSDSSYPVSPAQPSSFSSVGEMPYLGPPIPIDFTFNNLSYKAPKDPSSIPAASLLPQSSAAEPLSRRTTICGNCGEAGHNLRTCPENYCSYCAEDGHRLRDCALAKEEEKAIKEQKAGSAGGRMNTK